MASSITSSISRFGLTEPFELQVARGQITGHSTVNIFGFNPTVGAAFITPWELNTAYVFPTAAVVMTMVSTSALDTGMHILVQGLDADYNPISELVTITGTTPVNTTKAYFRINAMSVMDAVIVGNVTASNGGVTYAQITDGVGRTQMAQYTVPANHSLFLYRLNAWSATATGSQYVTFRNRIQTDGARYDVAQATFAGAPFEVQRRIPFVYPAKTSIQLQVKSSASTNDVAVAAEGILIKLNGLA